MPSLFDLKDDARQSSCRHRCSRAPARKLDYSDLQSKEDPGSGTRLVAPSTDLMRKIRELVATEPDDAIELIYTDVDALLRDDAFTQVDELLAAVDTSALLVVHLLALVSITYAARERLFARVGFLARVRQRLAEVEPGRVDELLAGFE